MDYRIEGGNRLLPTPRNKSGRVINITLNGEAVEAVVNRTEKYTYFKFQDLDYSVTGVLPDGGEYNVVEYVKAEKPAKAEPQVDPETGEAVAKPKRSRKKKDDVAEAEADPELAEAA